MVVATAARSRLCGDGGANNTDITARQVKVPNLIPKVLAGFLIVLYGAVCLRQCTLDI